MSGYSNYLGAKKCCAANLAKTVTGAQGPKGSQGAIGPYGYQGSTGPQGAQGVTGACCRGPQGFTGAQGPAGGAQGSVGATGATGAQGSVGTTGATGAQGSVGTTGATGAQGSVGTTGATGAQGSVGATGAQGSVGTTGATGAHGSVGATGATGAQGATGGSQWINMNGTGPQGQGYTGIGVTGQDVLIYGNLLVTGAIDPTSLTLSKTGITNPSTYGLTGLGLTGGAYIDNINLLQSVSNVDMVIESKGIGDIVCKTGSGTERMRIGDTGANTMSDTLTITNSVLNGVPLSVNNIINAGLCYVEIYNQRSAVGGETDRLGFFAKNGAGGKVEYSRISTTCSAIALGSERGEMELRVKDAGGVTPYINLSGSGNVVSLLKPTVLNGYNISSVGTLSASSVIATAVTNSTTSTNYQPSRNILANTVSISCPAPTYNGEQLTIFSEGIPPSSNYINPALISPAPAGFGQASVSYAGYIILADNNTLYYSDGFSNVWTSIYSFNGAINCLEECNGELFIGGFFTTDSSTIVTYNYIARMDASFIISQVAWANRSGDTGFNNPVTCLRRGDTNPTWLYVGGYFQATGASSYTLDRFGAIDASTISSLGLFAIDDNSGSFTNGFNNPVYTIATYGNTVFVGGEFTAQYASQLGSQTTYYNQFGVVWNSNGTYQSATTPEFSTVGNFTTSFNQFCYSSAKQDASNHIIVGGDFFNFDGAGINYLIYFDVSLPGTFGSVGSFSTPCRSVINSAGYVFAMEQTPQNNLWILAPITPVVLANAPYGNLMGVAYDTTGLHNFIFQSSSTITAWNSTQSSTLDLATAGFRIRDDNNEYSTSLVMTGVGSYFYGISQQANSIVPQPFYLVIKKFNVTFS